MTSGRSTHSGQPSENPAKAATPDAAARSKSTRTLPRRHAVSIAAHAGPARAIAAVYLIAVVRPPARPAATAERARPLSRSASDARSVAVASVATRASHET